MALASEAYLLRHRGENEQAQDRSRAAMQLEIQAVAALVPPDGEPSRSVLYRSAATLALDAGELKEAQRLAYLGLGGHPPPDIEEELQAIVRRASDEIAAYELSPDEIILKIDGPAVVGHGFAREKDFLLRLKTLESMVKRTADRLSGRSFTERGRRPNEIEEQLEVFLGPARAASYSLSVRFGRQAEIPGSGLVERVIDELMSAVEVADEGNEDDLRERIPDPSYRRNFFALIGQLQPDGRGVKRVGLTRRHDERVHVVEMTRESPESAPILATTAPGEVAEPVVLTQRKLVGELLWASSLGQPTVKIRDSEGRSHTVVVPEELGMRDLLIPLYERVVAATVHVTTTPSGSEKLVLEAIRAAD